MVMLMLPGRVSRPAATIVKQMDFNSSTVVSGLSYYTYAGHQYSRTLTISKLGFRILQNIAGNARMICSGRDPFFEGIEKVQNVLVSPSPESDRVFLVPGPQSHQRDIVLPSMCDATDVGKLSFNRNDLVQCLVLNTSLYADAVVQSQTDIQRETLKVAIGVDVRASLGVLRELVDACGGLEID